LSILSGVVVGLYSPVGKFLIRDDLCVWLVGWGGVGNTAKLFISGNGFDTVDTEHVAEPLDIVDV
jgi:hypothetical protein